jgi:3-dehydroquinate synthase
MREIALLGSRIFVWPGATAEVGENVRLIAGGARAFVLTDAHCRKIASRVRLSLKAAGYKTALLAVPSGEKTKSLKWAEQVYEHLTGHSIERGSLFVAVGGGVVSDLGGFVAATYMRGLPLVLVPTTLLAQVDAAIGGKNGVNLWCGKNLVGTFHQPRAVFIDPLVLASLPKRDYIGGLAEIVKCAMIRDAELFAFVEANMQALLERQIPILEEVVFRCASIKAAVVEEDEKEAGVRAILNYGHTIGHALESVGRYATLHHGEAVAIGMEAEAIMAMELGIAPLETLAAQNRLLKMCGLPTRLKGLAIPAVLHRLAFDKKVKDGRPRFVMPEGIGKVRHGVDVPDDIVRLALKTVSA